MLLSADSIQYPTYEVGIHTQRMWMSTNLRYTQKLACVYKAGGVTIRCKLSLPIFPQSRCTHYIPTMQKALSPWCKLFPKKIPLRSMQTKKHQLQKALIVHDWRRGIINTCMKCSNLVLETTTNKFITRSHLRMMKTMFGYCPQSHYRQWTFCFVFMEKKIEKKKKRGQVLVPESKRTRRALQPK